MAQSPNKSEIFKRLEEQAPVLPIDKSTRLEIYFRSAHKLYSEANLQYQKQQEVLFFVIFSPKRPWNASNLEVDKCYIWHRTQFYFTSSLCPLVAVYYPEASWVQESLTRSEESYRRTQRYYFLRTNWINFQQLNVLNHLITLKYFVNP